MGYVGGKKKFGVPSFYAPWSLPVATAPSMGSPATPVSGHQRTHARVSSDGSDGIFSNLYRAGTWRGRVSVASSAGTDRFAGTLAGLYFPGKGSAGSAVTAFFETGGVGAIGSFMRCVFQRHPGAVTRENGNLPSLLTLLT